MSRLYDGTLNTENFFGKLLLQTLHSTHLLAAPVVVVALILLGAVGSTRRLSTERSIQVHCKQIVCRIASHKIITIAAIYRVMMFVVLLASLSLYSLSHSHSNSTLRHNFQFSCG